MAGKFDVIVIGGGTAGLTAPLAARHEGATVALVEREGRIGGDCTYNGCVPSKALIEIVQTVFDARRLAAAEDTIAQNATLSEAYGAALRESPGRDGR